MSRSSTSTSARLHRRVSVEDELVAVGALLGLALFNHVTIGGIQFPIALYEALLASPQRFSLASLASVYPSIARSLESVLATDDVDALDLTYEVAHGGRLVELVADGAALPVTARNREHFVSLYTRYLLETSVHRQLTAFARGFLALFAPSTAFGMASARDVRRLLTGSRATIDARALEAAAKYAGGFTPTTPIVRAFWSLVRTFDQQRLRALLAFVTGSDRVPVDGLGSIAFTLQRAGDDDERLPTSSTCFFVILLPEYSSPEVLRAKLDMALKEGKGFYLK